MLLIGISRVVAPFSAKEVHSLLQLLQLWELFQCIPERFLEVELALNAALAPYRKAPIVNLVARVRYL